MARQLPPRPPMSQSDAPRALPARPLPTRPALPATQRARPDPTGLRLALGFTGVAAASAMASAFLAPVVGGSAQSVSVEVPVAAAPVRHLTQYIQLQPGQTAPPQAVVQQVAAPTPRIVTITTRQSGTHP